MTLEFSWQIFEKSSNVTFQENPCSGIQVVTCGQTDMTNVTVAFRNFAKSPKNDNFQKSKMEAMVKFKQRFIALQKKKESRPSHI